MLAELDDVDFETLVERIGLAMHEGPQDVDGGPAFHTAMTATLVIRAARRTRQLRAAVSAAGEDYAPAPLHAVRIAVKKLRYALELAHELKVLPSQRAITQLKGAQEMLGTMHDMQVLSERLVRTIAALPADAPVDTARALDRVRTLLDTRSREQHARYLLVRSRLVTASESVLDTLTAALPPLGEGESAPMTVH
jgi:CHAD domain-containing protein